MRAIDLRSDTVTLPPPGMREAMAHAEVGDDVYGEDPSINALEARGAALLGKDAGLFVPSGAMGNLLAVLAHCRRGDEIVVGDRSHIFLNEAGAPSVVGGTTMRTVPTTKSGELPCEDVAAAVRPDNIHFPRTGLVAVENTHNFTGGQVLGPQYMAELRAVADAAGVPVHLDGARLFNAAVALGVPVAALARDATSVSVCFSKGLAAPVGSLLAGPRPFIDEARRWRKKLGGGMRQAGILAAACLYALDHMVDRLAEDHFNARMLAAGLDQLPGLVPGQAEISTNIVIMGTRGLGDTPRIDAAAWLARLADVGVKASLVGPHAVRFVTHYGIERADVDEALARIARTLE